MYQIHDTDTGRYIEFADFADALALYRNRLSRGLPSKIISESGGYEPADGEGSKEFLGLSKSELEAVEACES